MSSIDMRTVSIMMIITDLLSTILLVSLWIQVRLRFKGLGFWAVDFAMQMVGMLLILLRGSIPDSLSVVAANILLAAGALVGYVGYGRFLNKTIGLRANIILLALFSIIHFWFGIVDPDIGPRNLNIGVYLLILDVQVLWLLARRTEQPLRPYVTAPFIVHLLFAIMGLVRVVEFFLGPGYSKDDTFFSENAVVSFGLLMYQVLVITLLFAFVISVNKRLMAEIWSEHQKFSKAFHGAPYAMALLRMPQGSIAEVNKGFEKIIGFPFSEANGKTLGELGLWQSDREGILAVETFAGQGGSEEREIGIYKRDGSPATVLISAESLVIEGNAMMLVAFTDISDRKRMEESIRDLSRRDPLTGLFNRRYAFEVLEHLVDEAARDPVLGRFSMALLDVDKFKAVNDRYGHQAGDIALQKLAEIILFEVGRHAHAATTARYGGEEFVVFFPGWKCSETSALMKRILDQYRTTTFDRGSLEFSCTFSCGVADSSECQGKDTTSLSVDSIIALVDWRMYEAKQAGRNRIFAG